MFTISTIQCKYIHRAAVLPKRRGLRYDILVEICFSLMYCLSSSFCRVRVSSKLRKLKSLVFNNINSSLRSCSLESAVGRGVR